MDGGVGNKQDVHFCRIGETIKETILTIKELLHQEEICKTSETPVVLHIFIRDTIRTSMDEWGDGGGGGAVIFLNQNFYRRGKDPTPPN